uniref:MYB transcription factor n=1 Tax=Noccaea caerulescens TaxID=107243 RepID=A0A1J3J3V5_NOCCA
MQGRRNNKWTVEEENALLAGIAKHGVGKWSEIVDDPVLSAQLAGRNNIQLKDKWRNIQKRGRLVEEKSKTQGIKSVSISNSTSPVVSNEPSPNCSSDMSNESRYHPMVFEAISTINDENGSDLSGILSFIEERYEVPQNFTKLLSKSLRTLVSQGNLEKVQNRYKISVVENKVLEISPDVVAKRIAVAEKKEFIASEAVKEAERMQQLAEESELTLQLCLDIHEQCALGKRVLLR